MPTATQAPDPQKDASEAFYVRVMSRLNEAGIPFLVGGAYALMRFTGIARNTKDFDIFVRREDMERAMARLQRDGCQTEFKFPHWLGKARSGDDFVDIIFSSGNAIATVDDEWFEHAPDAEVLGILARLSPPEEMIWSKAFIMERERFDGADVMHLFRSGELNWDRLLKRFGPHWRVLLSHVVMFGYIYPGEQSKIPRWVTEHLLARVQRELHDPPSDQRICRGPLISRAQYLVDLEQWGYKDARLGPRGCMSHAEVKRWTDAIEDASATGTPGPGPVA